MMRSSGSVSPVRINPAIGIWLSAAIPTATTTSLRSAGVKRRRSRNERVEQVGNGPSQKMRSLYPAMLHFAGVQDIGIQVALDVDRPAIGQVPAFRNDADQFELPPLEELAL